MKLLGNLLAKALTALGVSHIGIPRPDPYFRGPTPSRRKRKKFGYANGVMNAAAQRRLAELEKKPGLRDQDGAYTLVGRERQVSEDGVVIESRRKWLAGISARRGY